jgi:hypothetical protein
MKRSIPFIFCIWILFCGCPDPNKELFLENKYPSDVNVSGVGTLKYTRTLWDQNSKNNSRGDTDIYDARKIDGEIWTFASTGYGDTLIKGLNKSSSITIQYPEKGGSFRYSVSSMILPKGNYIIFVVKNDTTYYNDGAINIYYIARVHRTTMNRQYIRMPNIIDGKNLSQSYHGNGEVFFKFEKFDVSKDELIVSYYRLNDDCDNVIEITEENFNNLYSPDPDFVKDDNGRYYKLNDNRLEVSIDNGTTWYHNDMGTNISRSIIVQNESIYVFCGQIYEMFNGGFHSEYVGGGIHEFVWK